MVFFSEIRPYKFVWNYNFLLFKIHLWMQKWIHHAKKLLGHSDYTKIITQICGSNNFLPNFGQISLEKNHQKIAYNVLNSHFIQPLD